MGKRWIGRWIIVVAALHTLIGLVVFAPILQAMIDDGLWNSVGEIPMRNVAAWFLIGGGFMLVIGIAIDACEHHAGPHLLRPTGWAMLVVTIITIILMPVSGAWLLVPPAVAMIRRRDPN